MTIYEQVTETFCAFLPTLLRLQKEVLPSHDEIYWRSRWHEWIRPHSNDSKEEFERKRVLQLQWKDVWFHYGHIFKQTFTISDRIKFKTHLIIIQKTACCFLDYVRQQNQSVIEPHNAKLWYLRYMIWNDTMQHGGLATASLWPASWPLISEGLIELENRRQAEPVSTKISQSNQLELFTD